MNAASTTDRAALEELCINTIRTLSMDAVQKANSGHPGAPMALAPVVYTLYTRVMRHNPANPDWLDRDRFVLSAGHASMLLYSILHLTGYPMSLEDIKNFRQVGSPTAGHPERKYSPGIEATTGPLGQGLAMSVGLALGERMLAARFNVGEQDIIDHHTFTIASDGDMQEGVASEASSLAGHLGLGRLIAFYDDNKIQLAGPTSDSFSEDVAARYEAYGWHVQNLGEEISPDQIEQATRAAMDVEDRPSLILVRTHIGYGSPNKQDSSKAHGSPLGEEEVRLTKQAYGWDPDAQFLIPDEALEHFRECCERGAQAEAQWNERLQSYRQEHPDQARLLQTIDAGELPDGWDSDLPRFDADPKGMATRKASGQVIQWVAKGVPFLVGGSADLASSTLTDIEDAGAVSAGEYSGRNIHFGVREHGMGATVNGLALHGFRALGATFLTFSDYMRGAVRLSALMKLPSIWVYTHDSIGLGEDGPTHQPVEHLAALRAIPRLNVLRPADANETALAWRFALRQSEAPSAFALSRQNLPVLDPDAIPDDAIERGAYVLRDADGRPPELILIGTGSEVSLCVEAAERLAEEGVAVRVVSMPCMDTFAAGEQAYRDQVLPPECGARVAVEAASPMGWDRWIGPAGTFLGMETFGESGPAEEVYEHFGITSEHLAELGRAALERAGGRAGA
ncbi:MAG TPA: transketolase [Solirubrobacteraceae bacterium]|jgi:transketolase|nr:transketolase [Solirubrobacteraceae bacterium]